MDICSEIVHKIKNQEVRKIKKIKTPKDLPEFLISKDQPRKQRDPRFQKKFKLKTGLKPYKK